MFAEGLKVEKGQKWVENVRKKGLGWALRLRFREILVAIQLHHFGGRGLCLTCWVGGGREGGHPVRRILFLVNFHCFGGVRAVKYL